MTLTLIDICSRAIDRISSIQMPTFLVGNTTDSTARMLLAIAKDVGEELVRDYNWQQLRTTAEVITIADQPLYALEDDYERISLDTMWETGGSRHIFGAQSSRQWAAITNTNGIADNRYRWRLYQDQIQVTPTPSSAFDFNYEYLSKYYCKSSLGVAIEQWTADTDIPRLPHDLFIAGVRYMFLKGKKLSHSDAEAEYEAVITSRLQRQEPPGYVVGADAVCPPDGRRELEDRNFPEVIEV
jgi:hypothetical protein